MNSDNNRETFLKCSQIVYPKLKNDTIGEKLNNPNEQYIWQMQKSPNRTPASTVLNSPDLTEVNYTQYHLHQRQIRVGPSPINQHENPRDTITRSPTDVGNFGINLVRDGEIVVFDDIDTEWMRATETEFATEDVLKVTKMIGQLPIADYEGSPRRIGNYGPIQSKINVKGSDNGTSTSSFPPRPGFPQRIAFGESQSQQQLQQQQQQQQQQNNLQMDYNKQQNTLINVEENSVDQSRPKTPTFDYLYEFSETRKVLEEFFKCPNTDEEKKFNDLNEIDNLDNCDISDLGFLRQHENNTEKAYIGQKLARISNEDITGGHQSPKKQLCNANDHNNIELYIDSNSRSSGELADTELEPNLCQYSRNFTLSPETTDYDSNCGELDSLSNDINAQTDYGKLYTSMPVLEDGLSSGHASDTENNLSFVIDGKHMEMTPMENTDLCESNTPNNVMEININNVRNNENIKDTDIDTINLTKYYCQTKNNVESEKIHEALKDIKTTLQRTKTFPEKSKKCEEIVQKGNGSPVWVPRKESSHESLDLDHYQKNSSPDDEEADTDLETDRLLGQQRFDDQGSYDSKPWTKSSRLRSPMNSTSLLLSHIAGSSSVETTTTEPITTKSKSHLFSTGKVPTSSVCKTLGSTDIPKKSLEDLKYSSPSGSFESADEKRLESKKEVLGPEVLIEGVLFRAKYLGSTQLVCEGQPTKSTRMMQAEEAVSRIKALAPESEAQPSTEVDLFISTEKIMVLNTDLKEIMMDHALRTISYIADIGDLVVLMARRRFIPSENEEGLKPNRTPKMICHVFESDEAQFIAQSIGQAFQVAYMEFLKANGIEDQSFVKEMDYQEVLNSQEIFGDELKIFAKKELQKEVVVPKTKGEILGVVVVESGWGSMLPTVVIANLMSSGAAARCGHLNIGDQLIAINGMSLVGLPLSTCQTYIRNTKNQTAVKFTVVPCPPVVEVKIKRPNTKYQLGFSVQNGVICSLLRGGIAERGGVRVGHRIIEINNQSVVAVPHEKIVNLLATSVGEISMKTMPTSMFRLLTGQENSVYI